MDKRTELVTQTAEAIAKQAVAAVDQAAQTVIAAALQSKSGTAKLSITIDVQITDKALVTAKWKAKGTDKGDGDELNPITVDPNQPEML